MGAYYLIDQDCTEFIELMKFHGVEMTQLPNDVTVAGADHLHFAIKSYTSGGAVIDGRERKDYEGHFQTLVTGEWKKGDGDIRYPRRYLCDLHRAALRLLCGAHVRARRR